jgi:hypothetical protein
MSVMMIKKKRRVHNTRIEVTGFNDLGNRILDDEEHSSNNGHRCIDSNQSRNVVGWYSLDSEEVVEKGL